MLIEFILFIIVLIWLSLLTFLFLRMSAHYNNLIDKTHKTSLQEALTVLLQDVAIAKKDIAFLRTKCDTIEKEGQLHIQKIGLLRFNPFEDTGGDQSFILVLVDGKDTGVVISGLYSRSGTRWYAKKIVEGKGLEHELSVDEKKALTSAVVVSK